MVSQIRISHALAKVVLGFVCAAPLAGPATAEQDPERQLQTLRQRIETLQQELRSETDRRDKEAARLRRVETETASAAAALAQTRRSIADTRRRNADLGEQRVVIRQRLDERRADLSAQARAAYVSGRQERLRLMLNQQDPALLGRLLVYHGYVSELRAQQIDEVVTELARLAKVDSQLAETTARLKTLEGEHAAALADIETARAERAAVLARIDDGIKTRRDEVEGLRSEAQILEELVAELQRALANLPGAQREPFGDQYGQLRWPVKGTLITDFGQPRADGSLRWNGVLVAAERGAEVRAIYHGRVAYADWLPGMGLLIVLEHGDGYMSLYGHNEVLYKQAGDWIAPGDVIAGAGDSGGRTSTALYFEIRQGSKPQNPHRWFRTRLSAS